MDGNGQNRDIAPPRLGRVEPHREAPPNPTPPNPTPPNPTPAEPRRDHRAEADLPTAIAALAAALKPPPSRPERFAGLKAFIKSVAPGVIMFFLAFVFVQTVELDLKREAFNADAAEKIKTFVDRLLGEEAATAPQSEIDATGIALGGFGGAAALPLLEVLERSDARRGASAVLGLGHAARVAPDLVCPTLGDAIADVTDAYVWTTQKGAAEAAGVAGCAAALPALQALRRDPPLDARDPDRQGNLNIALDKAIQRITAANARRRGWFERHFDW